MRSISSIEERSNQMLNALTGLKARFANGSSIKTIGEELKKLNIPLTSTRAAEYVKQGMFCKLNAGFGRNSCYIIDPSFERIINAETAIKAKNAKRKETFVNKENPISTKKTYRKIEKIDKKDNDDLTLAIKLAERGWKIEKQNGFVKIIIEPYANA